MRNEPVITAASVAGLIGALLMWVRLMGWIDWTDDQFNQFMIMVNLALPLVAALWARTQVTPVAAPKDNEGVELVRVDGEEIV